MYSAQVIRDSVASDMWGRDMRLTTFEVVFPRFILAEFNTHRIFTRSSASSRAIPAEKMLTRVRDTPFVPEAFGANKRGMQAGDSLDERDNSKAEHVWRRLVGQALDGTNALTDLGVHKQWTNRPLEPYMWHTVIVTATDYSNFFHRRVSKYAQPEINEVATCMKAAYDASKPRRLAKDEWHLPYVQEHEAVLPVSDLVRLSTARCARVSYLTHDGKRDLDADYRLHDDLLRAGHMSPFEHVAYVHEGIHESTLWNADTKVAFSGNFRMPFVQYRKTIQNEFDIPPSE